MNKDFDIGTKRINSASRKLFIKASKKIIPMKKESINYIDKSLLASAFIGISFHLVDIPYYDARVSILLWSLFSSLKCILDEKENEFT